MKHNDQEHTATNDAPAGIHQASTHNSDNEGKDLPALKRAYLDLDKNIGLAADHLRVYLNGLPEDEMTDNIRQLELSDLSLKLLRTWLSQTKEDHHICSAIMEIENERGIQYD